MTYLLELRKEYALPILEVLQQQEAITLQLAAENAEKQTPPKKKSLNFSAFQFDTRGYEFNREETNER